MPWPPALSAGSTLSADLLGACKGLQARRDRPVTRLKVRNALVVVRVTGMPGPMTVLQPSLSQA